MADYVVEAERVDDRWIGYQDLFGGFVAAVLVDAAIAESSYRLVSFSANFVSGVGLGDMVVNVDQLHRGRSTQLFRLTLRSNDRVCIYASAEFVQGLPETEHRHNGWVQRQNPTPLPDSWLGQGRVTLPFDQLFEVRPVDPPRVSGSSSTWVRVHPDVSRPPGLNSHEALLTAMLDLPTPGLFGEPSPPVFIPTIDYTLHYPPRAEWDPSSWVHIVHSTAWTTHSDCADDVRAWDEHGNLVAIARQTRSVRWGDPSSDGNGVGHPT
jgi:acyl-CoA thioesterase